jgi:hypothetical protein
MEFFLLFAAVGFGAQLIEANSGAPGHRRRGPPGDRHRGVPDRADVGLVDRPLIRP